MRGMDFNEIAGKAQQYAAEHPEQVEGAGDKGVDKIKDAIPGGEGPA